MRVLSDFREMFAEQVEYRELLVQMTRRDLLLRYKQTAIGFGWAVFMPLVNTVVFSTIFARVTTIETPVPYVPYAFCGLWVWSFFASALRFSVTSLTSNFNLVSKVYFPREVFPTSAVVVSLVDFAVGGVVLVVLMVWYGLAIGPNALWLPVVIVVNVAFTTAVALLLAMGNLFYRDVKYLFDVVITVWMFATSAVYPTDGLTGVVGWVVRLNPMTAIIDAYREVLLFNSAPGLAFWSAAVGSLVALALAWLTFHRAEYSFAENI